MPTESEKQEKQMPDLHFLHEATRKIIVTGHYGSGKTEFSVSMALILAAQTEDRLALVDLDIVNPYFRSRERRDILNRAGISVHGSVFKTEVTAELPALGADVRAPLEDSACRVIVDAGGNDSGAIVLNQFMKYFIDDETTVLAVINGNRPETRDVGGAIAHIDAIEAATGLRIDALVNNSHLLRETTAGTIIDGYRLCAGISEATGRAIWCDCYPESLIDPADLQGLSGRLLPLGLYMRPTWLDV